MATEGVFFNGLKLKQALFLLKGTTMQTNTISSEYRATFQFGSTAAEVNENTVFADALQKTTKKTPTITSSEGLVLRYRKDYVAEDGSTCLTSWTDARTGVNTCVFKPADYDEENPEYRVEVWDKNGNLTEKQVAINDVDPKRASAAEMYAYSVHLEETGQCKNAVMSMMSAKNRLVDSGLDSDGLTVFDWTKVMRDLVQEQYTAGNREGYLRYKAFYDMISGKETANNTGYSFGTGSFPRVESAASPSTDADEADKTLSLSEMIRQFEEMHKITAEDLRKADDWREMSEDQWDKMLEGIDEFIDAQIERLREMAELQENAAQQAAMAASSDMRSVAASQAALSVAASGFMGSVSADADAGNEKNWTKKLTTVDQVILRTAKVAQEMETQATAKIARIANEGAATYSHDDKPIWHWHDGQFGYSAEVFKNDGRESEYTLKLHYDDGREETRIADADAIDPSNCNIVDLSVKMYHLESTGEIDNPAPHILLAHIYMRYRTPSANENTSINYLSWYEKQLELEMNSNRNSRNISNLERLLMCLSDSWAK